MKRQKLPHSAEEELAALRRRIAELEGLRSQLQQTEQALRQSQETYRALVENAGESIFTMNDKGVLLYVNPAGAEGLGGKPQDLLGKTMWDLFPQEVADRQFQVLREAMDSGEGLVRETVTELRGRPRWYRVNAVPLKNASGRAEAVLVVGTDVTEAKQIETELRVFKTISDQATYGAAMCDLEGRLTYVNLAFASMHGYTPEELLGRHYSVLHSPEQITEVQGLVEQLQREGNLSARELWHRRKDGSVFPTLSSATVIRDGTGRPQFLSATAVDITAHKQAEQHLRESEARYRALVEQIPAMVYAASVDEASTTTYISPQVEPMLGFTPADYHADPDIWRKRLHPDDRQRVLAEMAASQGSRERFLSEYRMIARDGRVVWFRDEALYLRDERGQPVLLQGVMLDITDRKQAEEALRQSRERLQYIIDNTWDILFQIDLEGNYTFSNKAAERITGYSLEELLRMNMRELIAPESRQAVFQRLQRRIVGETLEQPYEFEIVPRDGRRKTVSMASTGVYQHGRLVGVQGIARDVTERRQAEVALRQSQERYRNLVDDLPVGIYRNTPGARGRFLMANRAMARLHGYGSVEELLKVDVADLYANPAERKAFSDKLIALGEVAETEVELKRKDGRIIWGAVSARVVRDEAGNIVCFDGVLEDITERKLAEEALRESERRMRLILEHSTDGINIAEKDLKTGKRRLVMCNDRYMQMSGRSREELMAADDLNSFVQIHASPEEARIHRERLRKGLPYQGRASWIRPDGQENYYEWTAAPIRVGEKLYIVGVDRDITGRMRGEAALREAQRKLTTAREEERRHLAAELHDSLGQGLIALQMALRSIRTACLDQGGPELAGKMARACEQSDALIREVRGICRGLYPPTLELGLPVALGELARDFQSHGEIALRCRTAARGQRFSADVEIALFRIAQEAVTNSVRHARAKNISLELDYQAGQAVLTVRDDGVGFDPAAVAGKGLGLSRMQERAEAAGGKLAIDSGPEGTSVRARLPAAPVGQGQQGP